jgi:hypothetical protein
MHKRVSIISTLFLVFSIFAAICAPAYPADNAVVTGDGVRVRNQPSVREDITGVLSRGTRVEVVEKTNFRDTIDGFTEPWYEIVHGAVIGFVFGKFIALDSGISVPLMRTDEFYGDPTSRFIMRGLHTFGKNESDVIKTLGKPISRNDQKGSGLVVSVSTLTYDGLVIGIRGLEDKRRLVYTVSCTTGAYMFDGLRIGSSRSEVETLLGITHNAEKDFLTYLDITGFHWVSFTIRDGKVIEINFYEGLAD